MWKYTLRIGLTPASAMDLIADTIFATQALSSRNRERTNPFVTSTRGSKATQSPMLIPTARVSFSDVVQHPGGLPCAHRHAAFGACCTMYMTGSRIDQNGTAYFFAFRCENPYTFRLDAGHWIPPMRLSFKPPIRFDLLHHGAKCVRMGGQGYRW